MTGAALVRRWQDVLDVARPQYPAESFVPNEKPVIVDDAIRREVWLPTAHLLHPDDKSGRTARCGERLSGMMAVGEFTICVDCRTLHMAGDAALLPE